MSTRPPRYKLPECLAEGLGPFRYREIDDHIVLTSDVGDWTALTPVEFEDLLAGRVDAHHARHAELTDKGFLASPEGLRRLSHGYRERYRYLWSGPHLHILVTTLRCNHTCAYCHASRAAADGPGVDMTPDTARRVIDFAFRSPSPWITLEFQGGEPTLNFDTIRFVLEHAPPLARQSGRALAFSLVTNMSTMSEDMLDVLCAHKVHLCCSLDGHEALHNHNRRWPDGNSWRTTVDWMRRIHARYRAMGLDGDVYKVDPILTVTRASLPHWKEIIDTYVDLGCHAVALRPMDPFGWAGRLRERPRWAYTAEEYLHEFYFPALDYMIDLNRRGVEVLEAGAATLLQKMLGSRDPNYVDLRSPCGAAIGQIAYDHDGRIFTCDEGRMVARGGDDAFAIGTAGDTTYAQVMGHDVVKALVRASTLDGLPDCEHCAWKPWCGTCPVLSYVEQGNIYGQMRSSGHCARNKATFDYLAGRLTRGGEEMRRLLTRWTAVRARDAFCIR